MSYSPRLQKGFGLFAAALIATAGSCDFAGATTLTFALNALGDVPANNNDVNELPGPSPRVGFDTYGSNVLFETPAFITSDGTGPTPEISLLWKPLHDVRPNVYEFHSGGFWTSLDNAGHPLTGVVPYAHAGAPYAQIDVDDTPDPQGFPDDPTIDFLVPAASDVQVQFHGLDFAISNTSSRAPYGWTVEVIRTSDNVVVDTQMTGDIAIGEMTHLDIDFVGDPGVSYSLRFDDGGEDHTSTAIDNLSFSQIGGSVPEPSTFVMLTIAGLLVGVYRRS